MHVDTTPVVHFNARGEVTLPFAKVGSSDINIQGAFEAITHKPTPKFSKDKVTPVTYPAQGEYTLTSSIGKFVFGKSTKLSLAKLVRDSVMGQILNPDPEKLHVTDENSAREFMRSSDSHVLKNIVFGFSPVV